MSLISRHIEVLEFMRGVSMWRYTSHDRPVIVETQSYAPYAISRGRIVQSAEEGKAGLELTVPLSLPVLDQWRPYAPMERVTFRLRRLRKSDGQVTSAWMGVVSDINEGQHVAKIRCQSNLAAMSTNGLRRPWQIPCPHVLYGQGLGQCNASMDEFRLDTTLTGGAGVLVESADFADYLEGWFKGGFLRYQVGTHIEHRFILEHVEEHLTLMTPGPSTGRIVATFPGCDHSLTTCNDKFDNAHNYGGQHTIPLKSPFGQDPVF